MYIFELIFIITPIAGAVGGGSIGKEYGWSICLVGIIIGLIIGVGLYYGVIYLISFLCSIFKLEKSEKLNILQWLVSFSSALIIPMATPILSFFLSSYLVKLIGNVLSGYK
jgi:hypothetical protein